MASKFEDYKCKAGSDLGGFDDNIVKKVNIDFLEAYTDNKGIAKIAKVVKEGNKGEFCLLHFCHTVEAGNYEADINLSNAKIGSRCGSYIYKDPADFRGLPNLDFNRERLAEVLRAVEIFKKDGEIACISMTGPITTLNNLMDIRILIKIWRKEPDTVSEIN